MANIKKAFNFRNGVQVDDDNLIVNSNGLVGVGTTVPTEALDVRGRVRVIADSAVAGSGVVNATTGIITALNVTSELEVGSSKLHLGQVGTGVSVGYPAGIITASDGGTVTYYGDGQYLQNLPTSQWQNVDVGLGYASVYVTDAIGAVGIATVDPRFTLQIGGNNNLNDFKDGVGISSGGIVATGGSHPSLLMLRTGRPIGSLHPYSTNWVRRFFPLGFGRMEKTSTRTEGPFIPMPAPVKW